MRSGRGRRQNYVCSKASYRHDLTDVPYPILQYFLDFGYDLYALNELLVAESQVQDDAE